MPHPAASHFKYRSRNAVHQHECFVICLFLTGFSDGFAFEKRDLVVLPSSGDNS